MRKRKKSPATVELLGLMARYGLSQADVARRAGCKPNTVHYWLKEAPVIPEHRLRILKFELEMTH